MSQLILDDQLNVRTVLKPIRRWITAQRLRDLRPNDLILDDRIPAILMTLKQPTFVTIDQDFWKADLCNRHYSILYFSLTDDEQPLLPVACLIAPAGVSLAQSPNGQGRSYKPHRH